ncbi:hypothetical protein, partial [Streptomyces sp. NPDC050659]|uniref:hypothetical protein n=1 Tax=Streptomyces sp. NPDC050659 TaxID=3157215 RepID=UPI00342DD58E
MSGNQMPGHQRTQHARTTSDQNSALRPEHTLRPTRLTRNTSQSRRVRHTLPHNNLRLPRPKDQPKVSLIGIHISQHNPIRILRLSRPHQPPHSRTRQIAD